MGRNVMQLDEARAILRGKHGGVDLLGPAYVEYAYAAATVIDHAMANLVSVRKPLHFKDRWRIVSWWSGRPIRW